MSRKKSLIITIIMWILVIIQLIYIFTKYIFYYKKGINIALEGTKMVYGISAIKDILFFYIAFYFPIFIIWIISFTITVILTIYTIIKYNSFIKKNKNLK